MDYHALQQKLFEIEPSNPAEDLAKLTAAAQGGSISDAPATKDYVNESVEVRPGSLDVGTNSLADFAALAGVKTTATKSVPAPVFETTEPKISYTREGSDKDARIAMLEERVARLEELLEAEMKKPLIKPRDPNAQTMQDLRKSGAMGAHKDKKKLAKQGYSKHKSKEYEDSSVKNSSIKDRLFAELAKYELKR